MRAGRPNVEQVLEGLKDFQLATVEYAFQRMYRDEPHQHRFLVADEVGLGKTLVARGLVAKVVDHLWDEVKRIDVVYICSNADIARQNINRLRIPGASEFALASRVTMLPVQIHDLKHSKLNFVSFTPGTSFDLKSSLGMWRERALLYLLLRECWGLTGKGPLNLFQGNREADRFRQAVKDFESGHTIDSDLAQRFTSQIQLLPDLFARCKDLVDRFGYTRKHIPPQDATDRRRLIGELRNLLAATCIEALEPDLIILDEFQRFKDLLDGEDEAAMLARDLFQWSSGDVRARVLLLSATPYKMFTLAHEQESDDHYADFLRTVRFLSPEGKTTEGLDGLLRRYRHDLYQLGHGDGTAVAGTKAELERQLCAVMVRTERLAVGSDRDGMLRDATMGSLELTVGDIAGYRSLHQVAGQLNQADPIEFWKSAPYLLSFMEGYQLKERLKEGQVHPPSARLIAEALRGATGLSITQEDVERYSAFDPCNARLRWLLADSVDRGAWRFLWVPPCLPYYQPSGVWATEQLSGFTKRLVFSAWRVVPRMIGAMVSYAAERAAVASLAGDRPTWSTLRERLRGPLRLPVRGGQAAGMPVLGLMYPSLALAHLGDPLPWIKAQPAALDEIRAAVRDRVASAIARFSSSAAAGPEDERWYWAAPILLDRASDEEAVRTFWADPLLAANWAGEGEIDEEDGGLGLHLEQARSLIADKVDLGRIPGDLVDVLTDLALGGPGVAAARALGRVVRFRTLADRVIARREAARIAWSVRNLFNLPESVAVLRGIDPAEPYWRRAVEYCVVGNLQAVLDEYAHFLIESMGLEGQPNRCVMADLGTAMQDAVGLRTSNPGFDEVVPDGDGYRISPKRIRARFALRFGEERSDGEDKQAMRADQVRHAFNPPFWPFVLATTSVGQEGLDFHPYCHAVVHWNLPSNPVDLEQREGRVHRYKGHAVRKTIAARYRGQLEPVDGGDPWARLFDLASRDGTGTSEVIPYWVHGDPNGYRIERHVPVFPLSRDVLQFARLRRSLALYRMVFGQPRQDDLIAYLIERMPAENAREHLAAAQIDLQPPPLPEGARTGQLRPENAEPAGTPPTGGLGRAIAHALDRYPLVLGKDGASRDHPVAEALKAIANHLDSLELAKSRGRATWDAYYEERRRRRWLEVPVIWLRDERQRVHKSDDLKVELLLDTDHDGVHATLASEWDDFVPLRSAQGYADARRITLRQVLERLEEEGFEPTPNREYLPVGNPDEPYGVVLAGRFYGRDDLREDGPLLAGFARLIAAYEDAYKLGLAHPTRLEREALA